MGDKTGIEWTDATWNPVTGCTKVSQGCKHCYAERVFPRTYAKDVIEVPAPVGADLYRPVPGTDRWARQRRFTDVWTHTDRLDQPLHWRRPRRIFVNSMSDLFHEDVPDAFIWSVMAIATLSRQHTYQVLTKRPERMRELLEIDEHDARAALSGALGAMLDGDWIWNQPEHMRNRIEGAISACHGVDHDDDGNEIAVDLLDWPLPNVWLGVSVEDQPTADERIPLLLQTPAAVRFLSCEPLLGPIDLNAIRPWPDIPISVLTTSTDELNSTPIFVDWVITGGESGPGARPMHPDWVRSLRDQCQAAGVPFFFKQWGQFLPRGQRDANGEEWTPAGSRQRPARDDGGFAPIGKKRAGNLLDGRTHMEYPK